jgi:O-antigen/teichoic acid export membrane protein
METMAHSGGAILFASVFGNGLNYAFGIFLARMLGPSQFGLYVLGLTVFNVLSFIVLLGMDTSSTKFVSEYLSHGQVGKARSTLVLTACLTALCGLLAGLGLALVAEPLSISIYHKPELIMVILFFAAAVPLVPVTTVLISSLQAYQTIRVTVLIKYLWEPIGKFLLGGIGLWAGFGLEGVLVAIVVTSFVSAVATLGAAHRIVKLVRSDFLLWKSEQVQPLLAYWRPLAVATIFDVLAPRSAILILGYWVSTQEVGVYQAAFQTASILALVPAAFDIALMPMVARAWAQRDGQRLKQLYQTFPRLISMLTIPCCLLLVIFSRETLALFGQDFSVGAASLMLFAVVQLFSHFTGPASSVLLMSGHSRLVMVNTVVYGIVLIAANAIAIPIGGVLAAAVVVAASYFVLGIIRMAQVWRLHGIHPFSWSLAKPVIAGALTATALLGTKIAVDAFYYPVLAFLACVLYLLLLYMLKFEEDDRVVFTGIWRKVKGAEDRGRTKAKQKSGTVNLGGVLL